MQGSPKRERASRGANLSERLSRFCSERGVIGSPDSSLQLIVHHNGHSSPLPLSGTNDSPDVT